MGGKGLSGEQIGSRREEYEALLYTDAQKSDGKVMHEIPRVFLSYPIHNPLVEWEQDDEGQVALIYRKNFGRLEKWLHKRIGGPDDVRRPLDEYGSRMWHLMDGEHTILDICIIVDKEFKEAMSPVLKKVRMFLERLLILNLIILMNPKENEEGEEKKQEDEKKEGTEGEKEGDEEKEGSEGEKEGDEEKEGTEGEKEEDGDPGVGGMVEEEKTSGPLPS